MIPIVSIINIINASISAIIAVRLHRSYRQNPTTPLLLFLWFYIIFAIFLVFGSAPGIFVNDPYLVMATNIASFFWLYVALAINIQIPFIFLDKRWIGNFLSFSFLVAGL